MRGDKEAKPPSEKKRKRRASSREAAAGAAVLGAAAGLTSSELLRDKPEASAGGDPAEFDSTTIGAPVAVAGGVVTGPGTRGSASEVGGAGTRGGAAAPSRSVAPAEAAGPRDGTDAPGSRDRSPGMAGSSGEGDLQGTASAATSGPDDNRDGRTDEFDVIFNPDEAISWRVGQAADPFDEGAITDALGMEDAAEAVDKGARDVGRELGRAPDAIWETLEEGVDSVDDVHQDIVEALPEGTGDDVIRAATLGVGPAAVIAAADATGVLDDTQDRVNEQIEDFLYDEGTQNFGEKVFDAQFAVAEAPWKAADSVAKAAEDAGEAVGDAAEDAGDAIEDAADDVGDAAEDTAEDVGDAINPFD